VNKQVSHTFHMEMFNLKKLNEVQVKEKYCVEVSLQLWKIWMLRLIVILSAKQLERI
jgi:hypothetical protein